MVENILRLLAGFFVGVYVARYLGPQQFGIFSYSLAFVALFSAIAKLGLDTIVVRELVNHPAQKEELLSTAFWLKAIGSLLMVAIIAAVLPFTNNDLQTKMYIMIVASGMLFQAFEVADFYFQSIVQAKFVAICKTVQLLFLCVFRLYFIYIEAELFWFVILSLIGPALLGISLVYAFYSKTSGFFFKRFDFSLAKFYLKNSWSLIISSLVIMIYMRIDQVMVKEMLGEEAVGVYSAAVRLSEVWYCVPLLIVSSLFPAIINAKKISTEFYLSRLQKLYDFHFLLALLMGVPVICFSNQLTNLLYGNKFVLAGDILRIHMFGGFLVFMGIVRGRWMVTENLQYYDQYIHLIGAIANISFNLFFIPRYGVVGAAYGTLSAYAFALLISALVIKPMRPSFFMILRGYWNVLSLKIFRKGYFYA